MPPGFQNILFVVFFVIYVCTVIGNVLVILIIFLDTTLHKPMYFFLANLSLIEIFYSTSVSPNNLKNFLSEDRTISFVSCFTQAYFFVALGVSECVLLSAMAYDRYIAICQPLLYSVRMNPKCCLQLVMFSLTMGFLNSLIHTVSIATLRFCKDRIIQNFFCDFPQILKLACTDAKLHELASNLVGGSVILGSLIFTLVSYICILRAVFSIQSSHGKHKAFSTCGSHLMVVTIFYGTIILNYMIPVSISYNLQNKVISVMYGVMTPFINPIIYSFRNADFMKAINKIIVEKKKRII
ncbi:olfactory receptor 5F1-like [Bufo gargarizans]|uniref:olfactory receptor 5F1-like n=1 Tax=Bufo gargarizans TaxID=30331 RepID=UPI001CF407B9|nr:olfactory receptor 5F1-like [Bufo gargarizans]